MIYDSDTISYMNVLIYVFKIMNKRRMRGGPTHPFPCLMMTVVRLDCRVQLYDLTRVTAARQGTTGAALTWCWPSLNKLNLSFKSHYFKYRCTQVVVTT